MKYEFKHCGTLTEIEAPIKEGPPAKVECPECGEQMIRVYEAVPDIWHCQGAHKTDYSATGDRLEEMNKAWSKHYGEAPPPPAKDIGRNSSEPQ